VLAGDFKDMWEGRDSSDLMRNILKTVAKEKNLPFSKLDKFKKEGAEFQKTMDFILRRDYLIEEDNTYRFRSGLLRRWVEKQA
jgi:antitoxin component of RelBE/YafQ-DinJ toxin-antitoxin module